MSRHYYKYPLCDANTAQRLVREDTDYIVIHAMAEFVDDGQEVRFAPDFLQDMGLYAHYLVTPSGVCIQMLDDDRVGAHARGYNHNSVGIEVLVPGCLTYQKFTQVITQGDEKLNTAQHHMLTELVMMLKNKYPQADIVGHNELDPDRKLDPGSFVNLNDFR